jgi:hypothetical protein
MIPAPARAGFIWYRQALCAPRLVAAIRATVAKWLAWHLRPATA